MRTLPPDQQMVQVEDAFSLRPVCAECAGPATNFVDRPGVTISEGSNGFISNARMVQAVENLRAAGVRNPEIILRGAANAMQLEAETGFGLEGNEE